MNPKGGGAPAVWLIQNYHPPPSLSPNEESSWLCKHILGGEYYEF